MSDETLGDDAPPHAPDDGVRGRKVGEFVLERTLGHGGMGTVYEAWQPSMRRRVALKVLEGFAASPAGASRFEREAWIAGRLTHPNVVRVFARGADGASHYFAMELVEGESLHAWIARCKRSGTRPANDPASLRRIVSWFVGVAGALEHVHEQGVVHRDVKPLNLLLPRDEGKLLLTDFGLARDASAQDLTRRGDFLGTIRYMSPEQLLAQRAQVDHRSDLWSLGVSLYEAVTLELPYTAETEEAYISAVAMKDPVPARVRESALPRDLDTILAKCLERDRDRRYASAAALREDLQRFLDDRPILARRSGPWARFGRGLRRHRTALVVATGLLAVIAGLAGVFVRARGERIEAERLEWVLTRAIEDDVRPSSLEPEWEPLGRRLLEEIERDPRGELAVLAARAAARVGFAVPPFGLLAEPPEVAYSVSAALDPGVRVVYLAELERSWDGGEWRPFGWVPVESDVGVGYQPLSRIVPPEEWSAGPHRLGLRARIRILDGDEAIAEAGTGLLLRPVSEPLPRGLDRAVLHDETRMLGSFSITLFETYPPTFPTELHRTTGGGRFEEWWSVDRVRIVAVDLPGGSAPCFSWHGDLPWSIGVPEGGRTPEDPAAREGVVAALQLIGRMDTETPYPVAAEATLGVGSAELLRFPVVFGSQRIAVGESSRYFNVGPWSGVMHELSGHLANSGSPVRVLPAGVAAGTSPGWLELRPSREVALGSKWLDAYFGETVRFPVEIEVARVAGAWAAPDECW